MPDIAMCPAINCSVSWTCRRHEDSGTKPSNWQTYAAFTPVDENGCDNFWPVRQLQEPQP